MRIKRSGMKQNNDIPDKIMERIRKLMRLKESTTSEGEARETALASICYRFGRPIFCTEWNAPAVEDIVPTLERFAISQLHWFSGQEISSELLDNFAFKQISTQRQVTEGIF